VTYGYSAIRRTDSLLVYEIYVQKSESGAFFFSSFSNTIFGYCIAVFMAT